MYGRSLNFFSWSEKKLIQTINLGDEGIAPLEIRFLHEPTASEGFVGCAVPANIHRFFKRPDGQWSVEKVIDVPAKKVEGWMAPEMSGKKNILSTLRSLLFHCTHTYLNYFFSLVQIDGFLETIRQTIIAAVYNRLLFDLIRRHDNGHSTEFGRQVSVL